MARGSSLALLERNAALGQVAAKAALAERPKLSFYQQYFWDAFGDLSSERAPAFSGIGRIPFFKILAYARYLKSSEFEKCELLRVIQNLDLYYVDKVHKKQESKSK